MSVMNLGLEALSIQKEPEAQIVSYEYLDAVIDYSAACDELNIVFDQFDSVLRAAQNLEAVKDVVEAQGVTPALEALVGGNFKEGLSVEAIEASMEAAGNAIMNFLTKIWMAIKSFFVKFFSANTGLKKRLSAWIKEAGKANAYVVGREFKGIAQKDQEYILRFFANLGDGKTNIVNQGTSAHKVTLTDMNFDQKIGEAKTYAGELLSLLDVFVKDQKKFLKMCDDQVKAAQKAQADIVKKFDKEDKPSDMAADKAKEDKADKQQLIDDAKMAREGVVSCVKAITSAVAQFLANNTVKIEAEKSNSEKAGL